MIIRILVSCPALAADPRAGLRGQTDAEYVTLQGSEMKDPGLNLTLSQSMYSLSKPESSRLPL